MKKFEVTHIYHSGFRIDSNNKVIFIDVYNHLDKIENIENKDVYFFVTHSHSDHFSSEILNFDKTIKNVKYIFSDDVKVDKKENIFFVKKNDSIEIDDIKIEVFGTTDLGVSYLMCVDGKDIFHSGDLNWWHWEDNTVESQLKEKEDYQNEINGLIGRNIDIAFVPVDPRLGGGMTYAMNYFIETINPKIFIPMHFGSNYNVTKYLPKYENTRVITIKNELTKIY